MPVVSKNSVGVGEHICGVKLCTCGFSSGSGLGLLGSSGGGGRGLSECGGTLGLSPFESDLVRDELRNGEIAPPTGSKVVKPNLSWLLACGLRCLRASPLANAPRLEPLLCPVTPSRPSPEVGRVWLELSGTELAFTEMSSTRPPPTL